MELVSNFKLIKIISIFFLLFSLTELILCLIFSLHNFFNYLITSILIFYLITTFVITVLFENKAHGQNLRVLITTLNGLSLLVVVLKAHFSG